VLDRGYPDCENMQTANCDRGTDREVNLKTHCFIQELL
jgi:hypothetical protein